MSLHCRKSKWSNLSGWLLYLWELNPLIWVSRDLALVLCLDSGRLQLGLGLVYYAWVKYLPKFGLQASKADTSRCCRAPADHVVEESRHLESFEEPLCCPLPTQHLASVPRLPEPFQVCWLRGACSWCSFINDGMSGFRTLGLNYVVDDRTSESTV